MRNKESINNVTEEEVNKDNKKTDATEQVNNVNVSSQYSIYGGRDMQTIHAYNE